MTKVDFTGEINKRSDRQCDLELPRKQQLVLRLRLWYRPLESDLWSENSDRKFQVSPQYRASESCWVNEMSAKFMFWDPTHDNVTLKKLLINTWAVLATELRSVQLVASLASGKTDCAEDAGTLHKEDKSSAKEKVGMKAVDQRTGPCSVTFHSTQGSWRCECLSTCVSPLNNLSMVWTLRNRLQTPNPAQDKQITSRKDGWSSPIRCKLAV